MEANRAELRLIIEGLDLLRERLRDPDVTVDLQDEEYKTLVRLQDRAIASLEKFPY